jgi:hypothetical protein
MTWWQGVGLSTTEMKMYLRDRGQDVIVENAADSEIKCNMGEGV